MLWDVFCRVVDNFGDVGVCWRAARDLASRGERVRLWLDDASALAWLAPHGCPGVEVLPWDTGDAPPDPGDVVIEAFGCDPPVSFVRRMAASPRPPVWINLEYLSAQSYVERSHGLSSPQHGGPGAGLNKWFFYPGFTSRTGGLLRESGLVERLASVDRAGWLAEHGLVPHAGERLVSLFCYANPALPSLLDALAGAPTLLLATPGAAWTQVQALLGPSLCRAGLRAVGLPFVAQPDYDELLRACDLNFVRGEDSFVRAQWAARPFVWQIYPQDDAAHAAKLDAFLDLFLAGAPAELAVPFRAASAAWNGLADRGLALPPSRPWQTHVAAWRERLLAQADLVTQLMSFVDERR